jgi:peptide chain release factor 3
MQFEYKVEITMSPVPYFAARWLPNDETIINKLGKSFSTNVTHDLDNNPIVLFDSAYALNTAVEAVGEQNLYKYKGGHA